METHEEKLTGQTLEGEDFFINRTGIMLNPEMGAELMQSAKQTIPSSDADDEGMRLQRAEYLQEGTPIGSCPSPVKLDVDKEADEQEAMLEDNRMEVLFDKLGERLAFERQGTRLYEAFIQKIEAAPIDDANAPEVENLRHICDEELEHFELLQQAIVHLGGDATVETPSADVAGVISHGVLQIVSDPRTTVAQSLQAILTAELTDNDGWQMLQELTEQLGFDDLSKQCAEALQEEQEHLENVRVWLSNMVLSEAVGAEGIAEIEELETAGGEHEEEPEKKNKRHKSAKSSGKKRKK